MPVSANTVQFSYTGDGVTTTFAFPSRFLTANDIIVGVNGAQVLSGFSVTGAGNEAGGNVIFSVAPANGATVTLIRAPAISQLLDFVNNQTVLAQNIDNGLDKLTIIAQYLDYLLARTLRLSQFDTSLSGDYDAGMKGLKNLKAPVDPDDAARLSDLQGVVAGSGNVPSPSLGQVNRFLKATAAGVFGWEETGQLFAPDGTLSVPGFSYDAERNSGFRRASAGVVEAVVLGAAKLAFESAAVRLSAALLVTNGTVTAGTNAQGQGAMTNDQNVVTSTPNNPSGATLPTAVAGRRIVVVNRGTNPVNIYPASGAAIGALAANAAVSLLVGETAEFYARTATQWEVSQLDADLVALAGIAGVRGDLIRRGAAGWERLPKGTAGQFVGYDANDVLAVDAPTSVWETVETLTMTGTTVTTSNFEPGYNYRFLHRGVSHNDASTGAYRIAFFGETAGAFTADVEFTESNAASNFDYGEYFLANPRQAIGLHIYEGRSSRKSTSPAGDHVGDMTNASGRMGAFTNYATAQGILRVRYKPPGTGSFDAGTIIVQRQR